MAGKLKPLDFERETRPGGFFDGDGLYLVVKGATSRNWIYRYRKKTANDCGLSDWPEKPRNPRRNSPILLELGAGNGIGLPHLVNRINAKCSPRPYRSLS
jgi:hypothetical protein